MSDTENNTPLALMQRAMHKSSQFLSGVEHGGGEAILASIISAQQSFLADIECECACANPMPLHKIAITTSREASNRKRRERILWRTLGISAPILH